MTVGFRHRSPPLCGVCNVLEGEVAKSELGNGQCNPVSYHNAVAWFCVGSVEYTAAALVLGAGLLASGRRYTE